MLGTKSHRKLKTRKVFYIGKSLGFSFKVLVLKRVRFYVASHLLFGFLHTRAIKTASTRKCHQNFKAVVDADGFVMRIHLSFGKTNFVAGNNNESCVRDY